MEKQWYVVNTYSGHENKVKEKLEMRAESMNMEDYIYPNQRLIIPKSGYSFYITKDGDTLEIVRDKFNKNWEDILKYNETIYLLPGQLMINSYSSD